MMQWRLRPRQRSERKHQQHSKGKVANQLAINHSRSPFDHAMTRGQRTCPFQERPYVNVPCCRRVD